MKRKQKKLTPQQKEERARERAKKRYFDSIELIFKRAGFESIPAEGWHFNLGNRVNELDHLFIHENVIIAAEQTLGEESVLHKLKKQETARILENDKTGFIELIRQRFGIESLSKYSVQRVLIFYLYFSKHPLTISPEDIERFKPMRLIDQRTYMFFVNVTAALQRSSIFEIFRFLGLQSHQVGQRSTGGTLSSFDTSILHPVEMTGYRDVRMVSFMISPENVIKNAYVLRKDSWDESMFLYQRSVTKEGIESVRRFVVSNQATFLNNIILSLPDNVQFYDGDGKAITIDYMDPDGRTAYRMSIPNEYNSIGIIDGQHRVYAFYEGAQDDHTEAIIAPLRQRLSLLATGILYPSDWSNVKRRQFESELFVDINQNQKKVKKDLMMFIKTAKEPCADTSLARSVLEQLNLNGPMKGLFQMSDFDTGIVKTSSIISYALRYLVAADDASETLYRYWDFSGDKSTIQNDERVREDYVRFCSVSLNAYFVAVKKEYLTEFEDTDSMLLRVVAINGLIIAYRMSLGWTNGPREEGFYSRLFATKRVDFSKEGFNYAGSRYRMFAEEQVFDQIMKPFFLSEGLCAPNQNDNSEVKKTEDSE